MDVVNEYNHFLLFHFLFVCLFLFHMVGLFG